MIAEANEDSFIDNIENIPQVPLKAPKKTNAVLSSSEYIEAMRRCVEKKENAEKKKLANREKRLLNAQKNLQQARQRLERAEKKITKKQ